MENRFQRILLTPLIKLSALTLVSLTLCSNVYAEDDDSDSDVEIYADVDRRDILDDVLDTEDFEVGIQGGLMSIEDFGSSAWVSAHVGYHITEHFYLKARYGQAKAGETSFEKLSNAAPLLTDDQRQLTYYGLNLGYNVMPGEIFITKDWVFNSVFSIELGGGSTEFAGDEQFTANLTANYRVFLTDWMAWDINMSDYMFNTNITGPSKLTHNLNFATGIAVYF